MNEITNFNKGFSVTKEGAKPFDTEAMVGFSFIAKPMLAKGVKFSPNNKFADFLVSEKGDSVCAELYVQIKGTWVSLGSRAWFYITDLSSFRPASNCWVVEGIKIGDAIDISSLGEAVSFAK